MCRCRPKDLCDNFKVNFQFNRTNVLSRWSWNHRRSMHVKCVRMLCIWKASIDFELASASRLLLLHDIYSFYFGAHICTAGFMLFCAFFCCCVVSSLSLSYVYLVDIYNFVTDFMYDRKCLRVCREFFVCILKPLAFTTDRK